jgi:hypothetical protein
MISIFNDCMRFIERENLHHRFQKEMMVSERNDVFDVFQKEKNVFREKIMCKSFFGA